jgi:fimbrial chaperone protein
LTPATEDFVVFPPQIALDAKQSQVVRVRWVGNAKSDRELTYRVVAEQLPVNLERGENRKAKINLVVRYLGTVYIASKKAKPDLIIDSVSAGKDDKGVRQLLVTFHNRGTAHALLEELQLNVTSTDRTTGQVSKTTLAADQLKGVDGENVLAGHKRIFKLGWPDNFKDGNLQATFETQAGR